MNLSKTKSVIWMISSILICSLNDGLVKLLSKDFPIIEIILFRFTFAIISVIPFVIKNPESAKSNHFTIHFVRGLLFCLGIYLWGHGLQHVYVSTASIIGFTIPLFVILFSIIILKENVTISRILATLFGFFGLMFIMDFETLSLSSSVFILLFAAIIFAISDVINKKYVIKESMTSMILYYNIVAAMLSGLYLLIFEKSNFIIPDTHSLLIFIILGLGANGVLYCMLKAYNYAEASFLVPFKYLEVLTAILIGYFMFEEIPNNKDLLSLLFIIPSNIYIFLHEKNKE